MVIFKKSLQKSLHPEDYPVLEVLVENGGKGLVQFVKAERRPVEVFREFLVESSVGVIEGNLPFREFLRKPVELKACIQYEFIRLDFLASVEPWLLFISVARN